MSTRHGVKSMTALLVWSLAVSSACALTPQMDHVPEGAAASTTAAADTSMPTAEPSAAATTLATGSAVADAGEPDCSKDPWPVFKPAVLTGAEAPSPTSAAKGPPARPAPKPSNNPNVAGGSVPGAGEVIAVMAKDFRACFSRQLCDEPTAAGKVRLTAKINPLGQVTEVTSELDGTIGPKGMACLESVMKSKVFSPPEGGVATLVVPLNLVVQ